MNQFITNTELSEAKMYANKQNITDWEMTTLVKLHLYLNAPYKRGETAARVRLLFERDRAAFNVHLSF